MDLLIGIALILIVFITGNNLERILKSIKQQNKEIIALLKKEK
ncbi:MULTISPECIES: hypothetical protein [Bacillaceae]|nr:hypothetical protein [Bacillus sp. FJAT-27916]